MSNLKLASALDAQARLQQDLQRYSVLHQELFGSYDYQVSVQFNST